MILGFRIQCDTELLPGLVCFFLFEQQCSMLHKIINIKGADITGPDHTFFCLVKPSHGIQNLGTCIQGFGENRCHLKAFLQEAIGP